MVEVIAAVEMPEHQEFEHQAECQRGSEREDERCEKAAGHRIECDREIGAQHVLDAVCEVDEVHHAEHQRETGRDQEQEDTELQPVEGLNDEKRCGHGE